MAESKSQKRKVKSLLAELSIILAVILVTYLLSESKIFGLIEQGTYDLRLVFRPTQRTAPEIVYMNIDDASLLKFGRWPWPRSHFGEIVSTLKRFGAKTVFLDIEFPEQSAKILKESITGRSVMHSMEVFQEGSSASIDNVKQNLTDNLKTETLESNLEGLRGYLDMEIRGLRESLGSAIVNPDQVFADALRRCGNVYSVFFVEEPYAQVLVEAQIRLDQIQDYVDAHPDEAFDELPEKLRAGADSRRMFDRAKLAHYLRNNLDVHSSAAAQDLDLDPNWVSRNIETARQGVLAEAISKEVKEASSASFEEISAWVSKKLHIANPGNHEEFMRKFYAKASSQQIVIDGFSMPIIGNAQGMDYLSSEDFQPPIPLFAQYFRGLGFSNVKPDTDGSIRSVPLFWRLEDRLVKHCAFRLVCDYLNVKDDQIQIVEGPKVVLESSRGRIEIPVDPKAGMLINWAGSFLGSFEHRSLDGVRDYLNLQRDYRFHLQQGDRSAKYPFYAETVKKITVLEDRVADLEFELYHPRSSFKANDEAELKAQEEALEQHRLELADAYEREKELEDQIFELTQRDLDKLKRLLEKENKRAKPRTRMLEKVGKILRSTEGEMKQARRYREALRERSEQLTKIVKDRICMVGSVASGTTDLGTMPYQEVYPKVGVHANVINTILQGRFLRRMDWWPSFIVLVTIALLSGLLFPRVSIISGSILLLELLGAYLVVAYVILAKYGLWISVAPAICAIFLNYTCISVYRYLGEEAEKRFVTGVFAHYLSKDVIDELIEDPDKVKLGGEEVQITPFFSDVAGFSTISEKLTASQLVELLNEYLSAMTDILLKHGGTLDKFEGDAVIAFFGAPLRFDDHAVRACLTSIEMQEWLVEARQKWRAEGRPQMKARIGLSTGAAVVGNMGSATRFNYTMMGDTVNLAARLEGANKPYGTYNMMPASTYEAAKHKIEARELDRILVVGKLEPITVYELICRKGELTPDQQNKIELYTQGLELYRKREWEKASESFLKAEELKGGDPPSREYIRRCEEFAAFPPPEDWNGTYQMTSK